MFEKIFNVVSFIGAVQGVFLAAVFLFKKGNHPATRSVAAFTFIFSIGLLEPYLTENLQGWMRDPLLSFLSLSNFLYGPLLYLFVYFVAATSPRLHLRLIAHFLPFLLLQVSAIAGLLSGNDIFSNDMVQFIAFELLIVQMLWYNVSAIRLLSRHRQLVLREYSNLDSGDLQWLRSLLIFITGVYVLSFTISHLLLFGWQPAERLYLLVQLAITCSIFMMTYRLILHPRVFAPERWQHLTPEPEGARKYAKSGLKDEQAAEYLRLLSDYMEHERPYLDPDLTMHSLATKLNISKNHLTQIINERMAKNFYAYVNEYRVEEAKRKIADPRLAHLNLTGIALESGFKSKSAFNINFKKITGQTPTEWRSRSMQVPDQLSGEIRTKAFNPGGLNAFTSDKP